MELAEMFASGGGLSPHVPPAQRRAPHEQGEHEQVAEVFPRPGLVGRAVDAGVGRQVIDALGGHRIWQRRKAGHLYVGSCLGSSSSRLQLRSSPLGCTCTARSAMRIATSLRAVFSARPRRPLVLTVWLGHSSIASTVSPAVLTAFPYCWSGRWKVQVYCPSLSPGCVKLGSLRGRRYRSTRRYCTGFPACCSSSHPHIVYLGPRKAGCIITTISLPPPTSARATPSKTLWMRSMFWIARMQVAAW